MDSGTWLRQVKPISRYQFAAFRIVLGAYLFIHFAQLIPYGKELFSRDGLLPNASANFTYGILPNPLEYADGAGVVTSFLIALSLLSLMFAVGWFRRIAAVALWYGMACLFNRNNLIGNPSIPYIGLMLLLCAIVPAGEAWCWGRRARAASWFFPAWVFRTAWILMAVGYTFSGLDKLLSSPSWTDGSAMLHVLHLPLARPGVLRDVLLHLPEGCLRLATWGALALEVLFLPLSLHRRTRPWVWLAMVAMHLGIMTLIAFSDLVFGMLLLHFFTFDPEWLPARRAQALRPLRNCAEPPFRHGRRLASPIVVEPGTGLRP